MSSRTATCWRCCRPLFFDPAIGEVCVNESCRQSDAAATEHQDSAALFRALRRGDHAVAMPAFRPMRQFEAVALTK